MSAGDHFYGGQAVIEGVMMRGRDDWAIAVRRQDGSIHVETHEVGSISRRFRLLQKPGLRGILALGQTLSIGVRALTISANQSVPEEDRLTPRQIGLSMALAFVLFVAVFVVGPFLGFRLLRHHVASSLTRTLLEGVFRVGLFLGYLAVIGRAKDVRRVFEYHGAEHKTIAAYEHDAPLDPESVDRYSTLHVRCGTNFLLIVLILSIFVYAAVGNHGVWWGIGLRVVTIPVIAGLAYELLRLGARFGRSPIMRVAMAPGLWLQRITTRPPDRAEIEVAIASFKALRAREAGMAG